MSLADLRDSVFALDRMFFAISIQFSFVEASAPFQDWTFLYKIYIFDLIRKFLPVSSWVVGGLSKLLRLFSTCTNLRQVPSTVRRKLQFSFRILQKLRITSFRFLRG